MFDSEPRCHGCCNGYGICHWYKPDSVTLSRVYEREPSIGVAFNPTVAPAEIPGTFMVSVLFVAACGSSSGGESSGATTTTKAGDTGSTPDTSGAP